MKILPLLAHPHAIPDMLTITLSMDGERSVPSHSLMQKSINWAMNRTLVKLYEEQLSGDRCHFNT